MPSTGLVARADSGGLGHMTWEFAEHVQVDRAVVIAMGPLLARGVEDVNRYRCAREVRVVPFHERDSAVDVWAWLAECAVTYTAETPYTALLADAVVAAGTRMVVHAMPELFRPDECWAADVWLPTGWRLDDVHRKCPRARVVPVPIPTERWDADRRDYTEPRLLHVAAAAMLDRSGTNLLAAALPHVTVPCTIVAVHAPHLRPTGVVEVEHRPPPGRYWHLYDDVSALIAPRRYGGLSLVLNEAAGAGLGALVLDRDPERGYPFVDRVPLDRPTSARMAGGDVFVEQARAQALAAGIDRMARDPEQRASLGRQARQWADGMSWGSCRGQILAALHA